MRDGKERGTKVKENEESEGRRRELGKWVKELTKRRRRKGNEK